MNQAQQSVRFPLRVLRPLTLLAGIASLLAVSSATEAQTCNDVACPSSFEIDTPEIQGGSNTFKFQSRISQAKLPVGDVFFTKILVNLVSGASQVLCSETLPNVQVRDSVLNLEIGRGFQCQMDEIIAKNNDLFFQICIENQENCLKPVSLASVPYSVKATFARQAQEAHQADVAAQCHYAHRMTADLNLFTTNQIGAGYYDFHTPTDTSVLAGLSGGVSSNQGEGFIQWAPVGAAGKKLNICAKNDGTRALSQLDEFSVHSLVTRALGAFDVTGITTLGGPTTVNNTLDVNGTSELHSTLDVDGTTTLHGGLEVEDGPGLESNFYGTVNFLGTVNLPADAGIAITTDQIVNGTIVADDIASGAVTSAKILDSTITASDLAVDSCGSSEVAANAIDEDEIEDGSVGTAELGTSVVTNVKMADNAIGSAEMADNAIGSAEVTNGSLRTADMAFNSFPLWIQSGATFTQAIAAANMCILVSMRCLGANCECTADRGATQAGTHQVVVTNARCSWQCF